MEKVKFWIMCLVVLCVSLPLVGCGDGMASTSIGYDWLPASAAEYAREYDDIVLVDLENQHVYLCIGGEVLAETDCVSGDIYDSPTPTGLYKVWYKEDDFYMMEEYYTANAIFFNDDIALHDADAWRDEYGGEIYQGNGSHGCVNTPRWFAEMVYNYVEIGTPVYVF